jgi:hypothetical protein
MSGGEDRFAGRKKAIMSGSAKERSIGIPAIWSILSLIPVALLFSLRLAAVGLTAWLAVMWLMAPISSVP